MVRRDICSFCTDNGRFENTQEVVSVHSNVRRWKEFATTVWRCPGCQSLHCLERVDLGPFYENYPYGRRTLDSWTRIVFRNYSRRLRRYGLTGSSRVLDYGCGEGLFVEFLRNAGIGDCRGYDPYVKKFNDKRVLLQNYDFVICQDVIEHADDPEELIRLLTRCLRPDGILCIGTPRADGIDLREIEKFIHSLHQPYHIHILSETALLELTSRHGLAVERIYRRHIFDTPVPFVNWTFILTYLKSLDNTLDAGFDPPRLGKILGSPRALFMGLVGYWFPVRSELLALFRKTG